MRRRELLKATPLLMTPALARADALPLLGRLYQRVAVSGQTRAGAL